jgi:4-hydroxy-tetrahydrodipicolinate synthase
MPEIRGVYPVVLSLFDDEENLDFEQMNHLIAALTAYGVQGLVMFGVGSEFYKLSEQERDRLLHFFIESVHRRAQTIISVTAHSTAIACAQARAAEEAGADAIMLLPPFFAGPDAGSVLAHIREVIGRVQLPVILQYAPEETKATIPLEVFLKLAENAQGRLYVKVESKPAGPLISVLTDCGLKVLAGRGGLAFFEALERGAVGVMPGCSLADRFVEIYNHYVQAHKTAAFELHNHIIPYLSFVDQSTEMFLACEKYFLKKRGLITRDRCRRPDFQVQDVHRQVLDRYCQMLAPQEGAS